MEIESTKIGEYLRTYSILFSMSTYNNCSLFENFKKMIDDKHTNLSIDEFNKMILIKNYYSTSMLLFSLKDTFQKGLNDVNVDDKEIFINNKLPLNIKCIENFTDRDIIIYIRNAIAHNGNNLAAFTIDEENLRIRVRLENTIASRGINAGKNIPFEVEFDTDDLLRMSAFCNHYSRTINISGVDFDKNVVINSSTTNILKLLEDVINTTFYNYTLFNTIKDDDKRKLMIEHKSGNEKHNMDEFDNLKTKFVRKDEKIDLSDNQKNCIFNAIMENINTELKLHDATPLTLSLSKTNDEIKEIVEKEIIKVHGVVGNVNRFYVSKIKDNYRFCCRKYNKKINEFNEYMKKQYPNVFIIGKSKKGTTLENTVLEAKEIAKKIIENIR